MAHNTTALALALDILELGTMALAVVAILARAPVTMAITLAATTPTVPVVAIVIVVAVVATPPLVIIHTRAHPRRLRTTLQPLTARMRRPDPKRKRISGAHRSSS